MTPLPITVIIPCYNMALLLARAVESALTAGAAIIYITNDSSEDETWQVINRLEEKNPRVRKITMPYRSGVVTCRNKMAFNSSGLIVPLDADDQLTEGGLQLLYDAYQPNTWVYGDWIENGETITAPPPGMLNRKNITHATMLFHRDDWQKAGGYDPDFNIGGEDWAFQRALTCAGITPVKVDGAIYIRDTSINERTNKARDRIPFINQLMREKYGG